MCQRGLLFTFRIVPSCQSCCFPDNKYMHLYMIHIHPVDGYKIYIGVSIMSMYYLKHTNILRICKVETHSNEIFLNGKTV